MAQYWTQHTTTWLPLHDLARWPYHKTKIPVFLRNWCILSRLTYRVSQKILSEKPFCDTRFKATWLSTASSAANWQWKAKYPQTHFRKTAIQKVFFFGTPCIYFLRRLILQLVQLVVHISLLHTPTQNTGPFLRWCCISRFKLQDHRRWKYHWRLLDYSSPYTSNWNFLWIIKYLNIIEFFWIIN